MNDADRILAHLQGEVGFEKLPVKTREKLDRITQARAWMLEHKFTSKVVDLLVGQYGYSQVTAYRDINLMSRIFGPFMKVHKDLKRAVAERMIEESWKQAIEAKDKKAQAALIKNYIILNQLDQDDPELPDLSNFDFQPIIMAVLPEQVGQNPPDEEEILQRLSQWFDSQAEDVEVEDES